MWKVRLEEAERMSAIKGRKKTATLNRQGDKASSDKRVQH
jgi:hypothetical protein